MSSKKLNKYKLNILNPGHKMLRIATMLYAIAFILVLLKKIVLGAVFAVLASIIIFVLLILIAVQLHQDKQKYIHYQKNKDKLIKG